VKDNVSVAQAPSDEAVLSERVKEALGQLVGAANEGLLALSVEVGRGVLSGLMEQEVDELVGPKGKWNWDRTAVRHTGSRNPCSGRNCTAPTSTRRRSSTPTSSAGNRLARRVRRLHGVQAPGRGGGLCRHHVDRARTDAQLAHIHRRRELRRHGGAHQGGGGTLVLEPQHIPGIGRFAVLKDTEGTELGLLQPAPQM
jgi:hypothetical protein